MRITGGKWRGRTIPVLDSPNTALRPSSDKMRQAMINIMSHNPACVAALPDWGEMTVLDAFCGSGALGLEALSHGAAHSLFWDKDPKAVSALKRYIQQHGIMTAQVQTANALTPVKAQQAVDLIFLDPPYGQGMVDDSVLALTQAGWADEKTMFVCEVEKALGPVKLQELFRKTYGQSQLIIGTRL